MASPIAMADRHRNNNGHNGQLYFAQSFTLLMMTACAISDLSLLSTSQSWKWHAAKRWENCKLAPSFVVGNFVVDNDSITIHRISEIVMRLCQFLVSTRCRYFASGNWKSVKCSRPNVQIIRFRVGYNLESRTKLGLRFYNIYCMCNR